MKPFMSSLTTIAAAILTLFSAISLAQTTDQPADDTVHKVKNVKELLNNIARYDGQKIQVSGKVDKKIDDHSFILESGGLFNNEIVVLMPKNNIKVKEGNSHVTVTGTLRTVGIVDIEREYDWELNPELKIELDEVVAYIVADNIEQPSTLEQQEKGKYGGLPSD